MYLLFEGDRRAIARSNAIESLDEEDVPISNESADSDILFDSSKTSCEDVIQLSTLHVYFGHQLVYFTIDTGATIIKFIFFSKLIC